MTVVGGIHALAENARAFASCIAAVGSKPRQRVRSAEFAAVVDTARGEDDATPPDDPEYAEGLPRYAAVRRVYRSAMHSVAFFDAEGDAQLFAWHFHPRARTNGQRALLLRFAGALVLVEGDGLRQLYVDIQRRLVAEFRMYRPIWAKPGEGEPLITGITVFEQDDGEETLTDREHRLARELAEAPENACAEMHG